MSSLLFIIIINLFHNLIIKTQSTLNCESKYNDCFNCSVCGVEETCNCNWDKNTKTCSTGLDKILSLDFYNYFTTCSDDNSKVIIEKYCGNTILEVDDNDEIKFKMPENSGIIGTQNLYCEYIYTAFDKKEIYYTLKYEPFPSNENIKKIYFYLKITYNDETSAAGYLTTKEIKRNFDNVKQIKIAIYFTKGITDFPFSLTIERIGDKARIALYITIAFIILACLLCALVIYCLSKKISENARLRQRTLFELAMARQRGEYNNEEVASETDIEEENRKKIKILLKTALAAKKFLKKYGLKDGNTCTICIEEFKENKSRVSITPCNHVFHYKCLTNWLVKNVKNPKCPNCNFNLVSDVDNKNGGIQTIEVARNQIPYLETQDNNNNNNLDTNENRFITRNVNRNRSRINNQNGQNANQNGIENGGNINEVEIQNI